ncbi:MAG: hypothetical protein ABFS32_12275 [Bacteroidota bacterium]
MKTRILFIFLITLGINGCDKVRNKSYNATFPPYPTNLTEINSEYDDYNSTSPVAGETVPLCFSSTRKSGGENFDLVYKLVNFYFMRDEGILNIHENTSGNLDVYTRNQNINNATFYANTPFNELGPYLIPGPMITDPRINTYILMFSNNVNGHQDIQFTENLVDGVYGLAKPVAFLNSEFDDAYPSFNDDFTKIYFCSNRDGQNDIFKVIVDNSVDVIDVLNDETPKTVDKVDVLSSEYEDKCPYVVEDFMVFASNREGGYGGYDLYYSYFTGGKWSGPVNFGPEINTEFDEFRPIVRPQYDMTNDLMIFSSNRPGGKGGYDLYYVGISHLNVVVEGD